MPRPRNPIPLTSSGPTQEASNASEPRKPTIPFPEPVQKASTKPAKKRPLVDQSQSPPRPRGLQSSISTPLPTRSRPKAKLLTDYPNTAGVATQLQSIRPRQSIKPKDKKQITLTQQTQVHRKIDQASGKVRSGLDDQAKNSVDNEESEEILDSEQNEGVGADGRKDEDADGEQSEDTESKDEKTDNNAEDDGIDSEDGN